MEKTLLENRTDIGYCCKYREYYVKRKKDKSIVLCLWYCPWCGKKLPKTLRHKWFKLLDKEHDLNDPWDLEQEKLIPKEFKTDEWWKKREL